jgi:signal transduction histidine kinase
MTWHLKFTKELPSFGSASEMLAYIFMSVRPAIARWILTCLCSGVGLAAAYADPSPPVLTNAAQVRALSVEAAASGQPVRLRGVLLLEGVDSAVLADETAGIYLQAPEAMFWPYQMGDLLEVTGVSDPGHFAPIVKVSTVNHIGRGNIPSPQQVTFPELQTGRLDAQWVEVTGVVRSSEASAWDSAAWSLWLAVGGGRLPVRLSAEQGRSLVVDSELRLRGICFYQFNKAGQAVSPILHIPRGQAVMIERPAPDDPFATVERPASSLLKFSVEDLFRHRVRVRGVVTHTLMGEGFWLRSGGVGLRVRSTQPQPLTVGDEVTVLGFLTRGDYSPVLEDAIFRNLGTAEPPVPLSLNAPQQALDHDQDLVQLEAQLIEQWRVPDGCRITLQAKGERIVALLRLGEREKVPGAWVTGSRVRVVGICGVTAGTKEATAAGTVDPGSFQLHIRHPSDVTVLQSPSWWTPEHVSWVTAGVMSLMLVGGGTWFWIHRRRVTRQMAAMRAKAALDSERARIARDLHDEIGANLAHISILSTLASDSVSARPQTARQHSSEAASVAQQTIRAFDEILWSVNPKNDTLLSLSHYICRHAEEVLVPAGIACHFKLAESYPDLLLPPNCRHGLLLAVKEALHNVIKHAHARKVEIQCVMEAERVFLVRVVDDGCGMVLPVVKTVSKGRQGQGLENLDRRLKELGGDCVIHSAPGQGTQVTFRLPL